MANNENSLALEYARRIFDAALDWYKNADSKAQIILTLDGAFLAFLTDSIFRQQAELLRLLSQFGWETWLLLGLMCAALSGSILSAIICLWSRIDSREKLDEALREGGVDVKKAETYKPEYMYFFQFLSRLQASQLATRLSTLDQRFEIEALAHEIQILSGNVMKKHSWVNVGFALVGLSLLLFLSAAVSYVIRVNV
jgi:hypothetical protein